MPRWIKFEHVPHHNPKAKTRIWRVRNKGDTSILGEVKWYGPWRKYAFIVNCVGTTNVFEEDCLRDIANFVEEATLDHKQKKC